MSRETIHFAQQPILLMTRSVIVSYAIWQAMQFGTLPVILSIFIVIQFKKLYKNKL